MKYGLKQRIISYLFLTAGAVIAAFGLEEFLVPSNILDGGMVGVAFIISAFTPATFSIMTLICNIPLVIIAARKLNRSFLVRALYSMLVFAIFLYIFGRWNFNMTYDLLLATIFGGIILGIGVGIIIRNGGCLDGTESVAIFLSRRLHISVGSLVLIFNTVLYTVAGFLFGLDRAMYSLLTYFITSRIIDYINVGLDQAKAVMIISKEGRKIADQIYKTLGRTVTFINSEGYVSGTSNVVLYCVITRSEVATLRKIINSCDYSAFMTISDVSEIVGQHIKSSDKKSDEKKAEE